VSPNSYPFPWNPLVPNILVILLLLYTTSSCAPVPFPPLTSNCVVPALEVAHVVLAGSIEAEYSAVGTNLP